MATLFAPSNVPYRRSVGDLYSEPRKRTQRADEGFISGCFTTVGNRAVLCRCAGGVFLYTGSGQAARRDPPRIP